MGDSIDIISRLRASEGKLSRREQLVADYLLMNLEDVASLNQQAIADAAKVSVATVNRLSRAMGCDGFREFKIRLAQNVAASLQYLGGPTDGESVPAQIVSQVFGALVDSLAIARSQLDDAVLEAAMDTLADARRVVFLGVGGGSANVAREGANRFFRLGIPAEAHADGYLQRMVASTLGADDVVVAISSTGQPAELLDSTTIARQYGARTIALTRRGSELSKHAEIAIEIDIPEDMDIFKPSASRLVYTAILDVLAAGAARRRPEAAKENLRRIRTSLHHLATDVAPRPLGD